MNGPGMNGPGTPLQQTTGRYRIAMVCLGNICRSPVAEVVLRSRVADAGLDHVVEVLSGGTAGWHIGKQMDPRSAATLSAAGLDPSRHRAQQFTAAWLDDTDLLLAMDEDNLADMGGRSDRVRLLRDWDRDFAGQSVPDPYYGGEQGFQEVLRMIERSCDALVVDLAHTLARNSPGSGTRTIR